MSRTCSKIFKISLDALDKLPSPTQKVDLAVAMALSIDMEYPFSWFHIKEECTWNVNLQKEYGICLTKKEANKFIEEFTAVKIGDWAMLKNYTKASYKELFERDAALDEKKKAILATHAEWLHWCDYGKYQPPLPEPFESRLPKDWSERRMRLVKKFNLVKTEVVLSQHRDLA